MQDTQRPDNSPQSSDEQLDKKLRDSLHETIVGYDLRAEGYEVGINDPVMKALWARAKFYATQRELLSRISELKELEALTHEGRGTILWEVDAIGSHINDRISQLESQMKESK